MTERRRRAARDPGGACGLDWRARRAIRAARGKIHMGRSRAVNRPAERVLDRRGRCRRHLHRFLRRQRPLRRGACLQAPLDAGRPKPRHSRRSPGNGRRPSGLGLDAVSRLAHGTTVATNALLQGKGGRVALVTTEGFRDLLEIGRQVRPHMYDFRRTYPRAARAAGAPLRAFGERMDAAGGPVRAPTDAEHRGGRRGRAGERRGGLRRLLPVRLSERRA